MAIDIQAISGAMSVVVLALTAGGFYLGFVGLLLGVPIAVGVKLLVLRGLDHYRASEAYTG